MGMTDADYANKLEKDLKATSGYVFFFRRNLICWKAKLQPIIAMSTHEAELIAMHIASQEAMWLRNVLCDFKAAITGKSADTLYDDTEEARVLRYPLSRGKSPLTPNYYHLSHLLLTDEFSRRKPHQTWEKPFR